MIFLAIGAAVVIGKILGAILSVYEHVTEPSEPGPMMRTYPKTVTKVRSVPTMSRYATPAERELMGRQLLAELAEEKAQRIEARALAEVAVGRVEGDNRWVEEVAI